MVERIENTHKMNEMEKKKLQLIVKSFADGAQIHGAADDFLVSGELFSINRK